MHAVKLSYVGQTFALARCSDSREKKPRSRKSKEERKAMVEFFIKKYQSSNSGNFPSLNLTHKEVGGSFYTVREIVREIIQDNKVLRPGSPTSKVLNLVNCSEDQEAESFIVDSTSHLSISSTGYSLNQRQKEIDALSRDHQVTNEENCEILKSSIKEVFGSHPSDISLQLMHGESSHHLEKSFSDETIPNGYFVDLEYDVADLKKPTGQTHDNSATNEKSYSEVHESSLVECENHKFEQPTPLYQPASKISTSYELVMNDDGIHNESNNVAGDPSDLYASETFPPASVIVDSYNTEKDLLQRVGSTGSGPLLGAHNSVKQVQMDSASINMVSIRNKTEQTEILSPSIDGSSIDKGATTVLKPLTSEISCSPASETTWNESQDLSCPDNLRNIITNIGSACGESLSPDPNKALEPAVKVEHGLHDAGKGINSTRHLKKPNEGLVPEDNPLWTAVKAFLTAFIKFWTE